MVLAVWFCSARTARLRCLILPFATASAQQQSGLLHANEQQQDMLKA